MSSVEVLGVTVSRGDRRLLDAVDLHVNDGERLVLLGPSGAGKTMLLRCIAGLEALDAGQVVIGDRDVTHLGPRDRDVAMVNQLGSLQPHLDVRRNLGFPLRVRHYPRDEVDARVEAEGRAFSILDLFRRRPRSLSAGERHEVALAHSLVRRAQVLLLDEPFATIDGPRRGTLIRQLIDVQEGYAVTMLLATNDQRVAMGLAHRVAVVRDGRIVQVGTPEDLHARPASAFVAGFLGSPPMNLLAGEVRRADAGVEVRAGRLCIPSWSPTVSSLAGRRVTVGIRPEALSPADTDSRFVVDGAVQHREFLGPRVSLTVGGNGDDRIVALVERPGSEVGDRVRLTVDPASVHLFEPEGDALAHGV